MKEQSNQHIRHPRIERRAESVVHDDSAHLWAVSYSDFLMVLLSFFILFFSVDENSKSNLIQKIFSDQQDLSSHSPTDGQGQAAGRGGSFPMVALEKSLNDFSLTKAENFPGLLIHFSDDMYEKGSFEINESQRNKLEQFFQQLEPYKDQISLTFIGHTDGSPVAQIPGRLFKDNFDLSSIRATRALQFAVRAGFPEAHMASQGNSQNSRASRSLSVLIRSKGDAL